MSENSITRRDFIKGTACAGLAATVGLPLELSLAEEPAFKTRVVLARDSGVLSADGNINSEIITDMLDKAVATLCGEDDPDKAWNKFVSPEDIVGIKSNVWDYLPTPSEVEQVIKNRVMDVGVVESNIAIDDRGALGNKTFKKATALINVRPLKTHHWAGIGGCIKNYIMFVPKPDEYHGNSCADLGALWKLPHIKGKTRLNILVMLTPLFHGIGPHHFDREYLWDYKGIVVGTDPVAVDSIGLQILEAKRLEDFGEYRPMTPPAHHVRFADTRHGIGTSDPEKIELIKLGWQDGALI
ncbi:MAG: DUF362 domain-containing protein [candidate division Zixibacteria bacterium]